MKLLFKQRLFSWFDSYDICLLYTSMNKNKGHPKIECPLHWCGKWYLNPHANTDTVSYTHLDVYKRQDTPSFLSVQ